MSELAAPLEAPVDEKAHAIVQAARKTFLSRGFDAASMDHIALTAGVSKRTVYNRFRSKEELFGAAITETCQSLLPINVDDIEASLEPKELLFKLARIVVRGILQPDAVSLRRIAAFEAERTPAIGQAFMEHGPQWMVDKYAPIMERLAQKGVFDIRQRQGGDLATGRSDYRAAAHESPDGRRAGGSGRRHRRPGSSRRHRIHENLSPFLTPRATILRAVAVRFRPVTRIFFSP